MTSREVVEGPQLQGADEKITYQITTTNWASSPSNVSMKVFDEAGTDVTATVASGSIQVNGDVITLQAISSLTAGIRYTVEVQFTAGGGAPWECYFYIDTEA